MDNVKEILEDIEKKSNSIVAKLELLHMAEDDGESIKKELKNIKKKLEDDEITKFSYATMLEANKQKAQLNKENKKKAWDQVAEVVNEISDDLTKLKEIYNQKTESEKTSELIKEESENKNNNEDNKNKDITLEEGKE